MAALTVPKPVMLTGSGSLRWAVHDPEGRRSQTWTVKADTNRGGEDNVYIGARMQMRDAKLSLHPDWWQLALTTEALERMPPGTARRMAHWPQTPEFKPGWRRGAVILTPSAAFGPPISEKPTSDGRPVLRYPAPPPPEELEFHVLMGDATVERPLQLSGPIHCVGAIAFRSGRIVQVAVTRRALNAWDQHAVAVERANAAAEAPSGHGSSVCWGQIVESDGAPFLMDIACF